MRNHEYQIKPQDIPAKTPWPSCCVQDCMRRARRLYWLRAAGKRLSTGVCDICFDEMQRHSVNKKREVEVPAPIVAVEPPPELHPKPLESESDGVGFG